MKTVITENHCDWRFAACGMWDEYTVHHPHKPRHTLYKQDQTIFITLVKQVKNRTWAACCSQEEAARNSTYWHSGILALQRLYPQSGGRTSRRGFI